MVFTPGKRRAFVGLLLGLPLLILLVIEGGLRLAGFGGYDPVLRKAGEGVAGSLVICDQAGAISYFFANQSRPGYNDQYQFIDPKPSNVFRIFLLGESAAKGYPQPRHLASSAFLQRMLSDAWPDRQVEVINLGTTAVASFPVLGMLVEALAFEPDLVIIHTGHNEFFGAYGVTSISRGGAGLARLKITRFVRSLALVQAPSRWLDSGDRQKGRTLMEIMAAQSYTAPNDPLRQTAANNLAANLAEMLERCRARGVPAIVCTLPTNERDLFPVGEDRLAPTQSGPDSFGEELQAVHTRLAADPGAARDRLIELTARQPAHARARFLLGRAFYALGETNQARREFIQARDLDSMPWRATSLQQAAIRRATEKSGAVLCDLEAAFRAASPGGCIGWELMDDHVHPTLRGQALMAEALTAALRSLPAPIGITEAQFLSIQPWTNYAAQLGDNEYDRYSVDHSMRVLFSVEFMFARNREGFERFDQRAGSFEAQLSPELRNVAREWQSEVPHAGGKRPLTGMVARQFMREKRYAKALELYEIAARAVPEYTSWYLEYVYFTLACREKLNGKLTEADRQQAQLAIDQGEFLLRSGFSQTGLTERYTGRLHQLRGEFAESIPFLHASRQKLGGFDLVAADQALFVSLLHTGRTNEARRLAENGAENSGQYAGFYRQLLQVLDAPQSAPASAE